jgi:hypothetical protein
MQNFYTLTIIVFFSFRVICQSTLITPGDSQPNIIATSANSGIIPPKLTSAQRDAIVNPIEGMTIYNITSHCIEFYRGSSWYNICSNSNVSNVNNKLYGGNSTEFFTRGTYDGDGHPVVINLTSDGGYILAGATLSSANGNVIDTNHGGYDIWVVKFDASGNIQWQKLLGGDLDEYAFQIQQTSDGGYIIGGNSNSSQSGDVTQTSRGDIDFWVVKLTSAGGISWNKLLGGSSTDFLSDLKQTTDGGYIATGFSRSSHSGDITDINKNDKDYWVVKLDISGAISWNKLIGCNTTEAPFAISQTSDGGYIVGGVSDGDNNGDVTNANHGYYDFWLVKLNAVGTIQWNKLYGGLDYEGIYSMQVTSDGGYILAGLSQSSSTGDVVGNNRGGYDSWIMKVDNLGNIAWTKLLGGAGDDFATYIIQNPDNSYILIGNSTSSTSGDVTATNHGNNDYWITKFSATGTILWNKLLGGNGDDRAYSIARLSNGDYIVAGVSSSSSNGDVIDTNHGNSDFWIVKIDANGNIK